MYFRNAQGVRKRIEATGDSRASARRRLFATLGEAMAAGGLGYSPRSTFADVAADWLESLDELVAAGRRSPRTVAHYRPALTRHVLPGLGGLLGGQRDRALPLRRDAMRHNPVRDVEALERPSMQEARALTDEECRAWLMILDGSELARQADLPELVRFLLGTGCRIGEALALTWPSVDLERT